MMKTRIYSALFATALAAATVTPQPLQAQSNETYFVCADGYDIETGQRQPTTFAGTAKDKIAVVVWTSKQFDSHSPQQRCEAVSQRMHDAYHQNKLHFITNGTINAQKVICTADVPGGSCSQLLMTLRPEDDSLQILNHFRELFNAHQVGPVRHSSGQPQVYYQIDVDAFFANLPVVQD